MELVSIIMPNYNSEKFIKESIESVLNQTYSNLELIIIDDNSKDLSLKKIKEIEDSRIKLIKLKINQGAAIARNEGLKISRGRYLAFLDSDDVLNKDTIEKQIKFLKNKKSGLVFGAFEQIKENGEKIKIEQVPEMINYKSLLKTCPIKLFTVLIDSHKIKKDIIFPEICEKREDYGCWLNLIKELKIFYGNNEVLGKYRINSQSVSRKKYKMAYYQYNVYRKYEKLSILKSLYYIFNWAYFGIKKYY
ncbi:MAG: glycosyltransferase family 2 protein [Cetobacterium sp.]